MDERDQFDKQAEQTLPCEWPGVCFTVESREQHIRGCRANSRSAIAALLRSTDAAKQREIDELQQPMECGHYGANLQPDDSNTDVCMVCAEILEATANARRETWEKAAIAVEAHQDHGEFWHGPRDFCIQEATKELRAEAEKDA